MILTQKKCKYHATHQWSRIKWFSILFIQLTKEFSTCCSILLYLSCFSILVILSKSRSQWAANWTTRRLTKRELIIKRYWIRLSLIYLISMPHVTSFTNDTHFFKDSYANFISCVASLFIHSIVITHKRVKTFHAKFLTERIVNQKNSFKDFIESVILVRKKKRMKN